MPWAIYSVRLWDLWEANMGFRDGFATGASVRNQRETRLELKRQRDQELAAKGYKFDESGQMFVRPGSGAEAEQMQALEATQLAKATQAKLAAQDTDRAFEDYSHTGDASYLQKALDNNQYLKNMWAQQGVHLIGNIDFGNDKNLLAQKGLTDTMYDTPEKQDVIKRNMYKFYDGKEWQMGMLAPTAAELGVKNRLGERRGGVIDANQEKLFSLLSGPKVSPHTADGHKYQKEIELASNETGIPPDLIASMIHQESGSNPTAVSSKGAQGLMQLMPDTAKELGVTDPTNPEQNIKAGAQYLKKMLDKYGGDVKMALAAYNAGPGNVDKYKGIPPFAETQKYVSNILNNYNTAGAYYNTNADALSQQLSSQYAGAQTTEDIILGSQASRAQAAAGLAPGMAQTKLDQTQQELNLKAEANKIDWMKLVVEKQKADGSGTTNDQKNIAAAERATSEMLDMFGGEDQFMKTDFSKADDYRKVYPYLTKIEKFEGTQLSEADKKEIGDLKQMIALAGPSAMLSDAETGLYDKKFNDYKAYLDEKVGGKQATSAYAAMRNVFRHSLYGSALTGTEIDAFNAAYAELGQKEGPVKAALITMLTQEKAKLDTVMMLQNPYSAHVRLGADKKKLEDISSRLQDSIDLIDGKLDKQKYLAKYAAKASTQPQAATQTAQPQKVVGARPSLDEIFGSPVKGQ